MKKIIILAIIAVMLIVGGVSWALADTSKIPKPKAIVSEVKGSAEIQKSNSGEWTILEVGIEPESGDIVRTGEDGSAVFNFYDNAISRLGPSSQVGFDEIFLDQENVNKVNIGIKMEVGKIWSQIIQLLDADSSFEIKSSNTVATVRGTVFDFVVTPEGAAKISSDESYVEIAMAGESTSDSKENIINHINLLEGHGIEIKQNASPEDLKAVKPQILGDEYHNSNWVKENLLLDAQSAEELKQKREAANKEFAGILPNSPLYNLKKIGEQLRFAVANDDKKAELKNNLIEKRLSEGLELARQGKEALAERQIDIINNQLENLSDGNASLKYKIRNQLLNDNDIFNSELLNKIENLEINTANNPQEKGFIRAKQLERQINKAKALKLDGEGDKFKEDLKKIDSELQDRTQYNQEYFPRLEIKRELLNNLENLSPLLPPVPTEGSAEINNNNISPSSVVDPSPVKTMENQIPAEVITPLPAPTLAEPLIANPPLKKIQVFKISAPKYNMLASAQLQFKAVIVFDDGTIKDVTNSADWSLAGDIGAISQSGLLSSDNDGGKGVVSASFNGDGVSWSAQSPEVTALVLDIQ